MEKRKERREGGNKKGREENEQLLGMSDESQNKIRTKDLPPVSLMVEPPAKLLRRNSKLWILHMLKGKQL